MVWRRKEREAAWAYYLRAGNGNSDGRIPKGYVPMLVGNGEGAEERILVHVRLLKEPCMAALLEMAAQQFGYCQQGVLRLPCEAQSFEQMVNVTCKAR